MLVDKPIAFTIDDFEEYKDGSGFAVENPDHYRTGDKIGLLQDLEKFIDDISAGYDTWSNPLYLKQSASQRFVDQRKGNFIFGRKYFFFRKTALFTQCFKRITKPILWNIKLIVYESITAISGISKKNTILTVFFHSKPAAMLPFSTNRMCALLNKSGVINRQHAAFCTELL